MVFFIHSKYLLQVDCRKAFDHIQVRTIFFKTMSSYNVEVLSKWFSGIRLLLKKIETDPVLRTLKMFHFKIVIFFNKKNIKNSFTGHFYTLISL